jgi:hypothetical protein
LPFHYEYYSSCDKPLPLKDDKRDRDTRARLLYY